MDRATGILLYVKDQSGGFDLQVRMFAPLYGVPEDPATGSANVALVGLLASLRPERDVSLELRIAQGVDMGRPSLLPRPKSGTASLRRCRSAAAA